MCTNIIPVVAGQSNLSRLLTMRFIEVAYLSPELLGFIFQHKYTIASSKHIPKAAKEVTACKIQNIIKFSGHSIILTIPTATAAFWLAVHQIIQIYKHDRKKLSSPIQTRCE